MGVPSWMDQAAQAQKRRHRMMVVIVTAAGLLSGEVSGCVPRKRLDWNARNQRLLLEGQFKQCYRMGVHFFEKLFLLIWPMLTCDEVESKQRTGIDPITPQNMLQMMISWLAGSSYHTTRCLGGVSPSAFYDITVVSALCDCEKLRIRSPTESEERWQELDDGFPQISKDAEEVPDVAAFFSGHYQLYGLNVQSICDSLCRYTGYCFGSPGRVGDSIAIKKWTLSDAILALPPGYYCAGDKAYPLSDSFLVPYNKLECKAIQDSDYNFFFFT
ncbi:hypothetical protein F444_21720 [Phytophthora nicotianae P1976]|uniref:DDE Tnp4 domain-containing protein n=1 Tax=Phytophthora nicotianae P1976 TaxID=1317066 RepID=A0A080Z057_PHYNI|nr:hypothetical protein F444_21720 [Phytophthora nicotianae P1976]